jgi:hypothetical protein
MIKFTRKQALILGAAIATVSAPVLANHSWNNYHWVRTTQEISPPVGDNVDATWQSYLVTAVNDWNQSAVIQSPLVAGSSNPKNCRGVAGTIQVCNSRYGQTGWLGIASISLSGGHISQGTTKLNDTYFSSPQYNTPSWRALVTCQEIGHDYGLGHQDEDFNTDLTNSCMDYTNLPAGNEHPDTHDYQQLTLIYNHFENAMSSTFGGNGAAGVAEIGDSPAEWGRAVHFDRQGRPDYFERIDGPGRKTVTHVLWAIGEGPRGRVE